VIVLGRYNFSFAGCVLVCGCGDPLQLRSFRQFPQTLEVRGHRTYVPKFVEAVARGRKHVCATCFRTYISPEFVVYIDARVFCDRIHDHSFSPAL
jgi:hypothetical protein